MTSIDKTLPDTATPSLAARRYLLPGLLLIALIVLPLLLSDYIVFRATLALIFAIAILGLNILVGYNGQISLGHGAFYAIGAYSAGILMDRFGMPFWAVPFIAGAVCLGFGYLIGFPALRLGGIYLALATFALSLAVPQILKHGSIEDYTGGVQGLVLFKPMSPFYDSLPIISDDRFYYYVVLLFAVGAFWLGANIVRSRVGRALIAVRDQPTAAAAMGINLALYKTTAFGISAGFTGVAGALGGLAVGFISPDSFPSFLSITLLVGVVIGGLGSLWGTMLGALFVLIVPDLAESISQSAPSAVYGVLLIAVMLIAPAGIAGALKSLPGAAGRGGRG